MDVAALFAFVSAATPQADGSSGPRGNCPLPFDQFGSALELALQGEQAAAAVQAGPSSLPGLPVLREPGVGMLPILAFLQAAGDGGAVPNLAGDGVNAGEDPAKDVTQDLTKTLTKDLTKDLTMVLTKDRTQGLTWGPTQSVTQSLAQDLAQGLTQEATKDPAEDPADDLDPSALALLAAAATPAGTEREPIEPKRHIVFGAQTARTEGTVPAVQGSTPEEPTGRKTGALPDRSAPTGNETAIPPPPTIPLAADPTSATALLGAASAENPVVLETPSNVTTNAMPQAWSTRPVKPETGRQAPSVNTGLAPDGGLPSGVVPLKAVSTDSVPATEGHRGSVPGFDPAPGHAASSDPVPADLPARLPGLVEHRPVTAEDLRATTDIAPQAFPATGSEQTPDTFREGWRAPEGITAQATGAAQYTTPAPFVRPDSARFETPAPPVLDGPAGTALPILPRAWSPVEVVATPEPTTAQAGAQSNPQPGALPDAQPNPQSGALSGVLPDAKTVFRSGVPLATPAVLSAPQGVGESVPATEGAVARRVDTIPLAQQAELPELVEGRASKAYLRSQADVEIPTPDPEMTTRAMGAAELRGAGDRHPERDARQHHAPRQPFVSAPFIESLGAGGGLDQVFGARTPATPGGDSTPVAQGPTSGGEPLDHAIVKSLKLQWNQGAGEARLRLQPEFLGDLSVSLRVIGASVTAVLQSDSPAVREWIQAHQGDLRRALEEAGLSLDRLVVDEDGHPQEQQEQSAQDRPRQSNRRKPEAGRFEALL